MKTPKRSGSTRTRRTATRIIGYAVLVFFALALALGFGASEEIRTAAGILFFLAYPVYVWRTLVRGGPAQSARIGDTNLTVPLHFQALQKIAHHGSEYYHSEQDP